MIRPVRLVTEVIREYRWGKFMRKKNGKLSESNKVVSIVSADIVRSTEALSLADVDVGQAYIQAILKAMKTAVERFAARVDTAVVLVNASTRFNDGSELGLGAEIGISTDKLHARGPCGPRELTTYKYVVMGNGQTKGS